MDSNQLHRLLERVRDHEITIDAALESLRHLPYEDIGYAKVDHHRALRHGMPEVILGKGKTADQVAGIASALLAQSANLLVTRATEEMASRVAELAPETEFFPASGIVRVWRDRTIRGKGKIAAICAGTSDLPVLEEAHLTAETMGNQVEVICDVGARRHCLCRHGGRIAQCSRRPCLLSGHCGPD